MLDRDLAELYRVKTKILNQAVKRNSTRFPDDFMFKLTEKEKDEVVTNCDHLQELKYSYQLPLAFTELGVAMLSSVLTSKKAVQINMQIMRAFVHLKEMISSHKELRNKIKELESKYDHQFQVVFDVIKKLLEPNKKRTAKIGFRRD